MSESTFDRMVTHTLAEMAVFFTYGRTQETKESEWRLGVQVEGGAAVQLHLARLGDWLFVRSSIDRSADTIASAELLELQSKVPLARLVVTGEAAGRSLMALAEVHSSDVARVPVVARAINAVAQLASDASVGLDRTVTPSS